MRGNVFRDGKLYVMAEKCETCIFRAGNLMHLQPGRVKDMVAECQAQDGGHVPCHKTLEGDQAICRGFWDAYGHDSGLLQMAERMGLVEEQQ